MLKFVVLSLLALGCHAVGHATVGARYGQSGQGARYQSYGASYQGQAGHVAQPVASYQTGYVAQPVGANLASRSYYTHPSGAAVQSYGLLRQYAGEARQGVVNAAVQQLGRTVEYKVVPYQESPFEAQVVEVEPSDTPLHIHFKTRSSSVSLSQSHTPGVPQEAQVTSSQDEPSRLVHEIQKPVIQEVREVITPYRQVTQEIQPVVEALHTVVTKAEGQRAQYQGNAGVQYQSAGTQYQSAGTVGTNYGAASTVSRHQSYNNAAPAVKPAAVSRDPCPWCE